MEQVGSLTGFEENFIGGISQNANLDFEGAPIVYLRENVFRPLVELLKQGSGHIAVGSKFSLFVTFTVTNVGWKQRANNLP